MIGLRLRSGTDAAGNGNSAVKIMPQNVMNDSRAGVAGSSSAGRSPHSAVGTSPGVSRETRRGYAVALAMRTALSRIGANEPDAMRGDPEGVHRLRSASRRLRSELRALEDLVEERWRERSSAS